MDKPKHYYTVIAYIVPDGGAFIMSVWAETATRAAVKCREDICGLSKDQFEVIAVTKGECKFESVDSRVCNLFPFSSQSI